MSTSTRQRSRPPRATSASARVRPPTAVRGRRRLRPTTVFPTSAPADPIPAAADHLMRYFYDCEFIEDGRTIELVSIGVVDEAGREFYAVSTEFDPSRAIPWVRDNG